ncbi:MAG: hypothetical protein HGB18_00305 [Candidatus Moranbacteria bacterium]|nr:hypothetical protein [Candidatus Moranbacteria bacterium]
MKKLTRLLFLCAVVFALIHSSLSAKERSCLWKEVFVPLDTACSRNDDIYVKLSGKFRVLDVDRNGARMLAHGEAAPDFAGLEDDICKKNQQSTYPVMIYCHPMRIITKTEETKIISNFKQQFPGKQGYLIFFIGQEQGGCLMTASSDDELRLMSAELDRIVSRAGATRDGSGRWNCIRPHMLPNAIL